MVVNVITRHAPANYGSLLQTIATQTIVNALGYDCKIIDYIPKCETGAQVAFTQLKGKKHWNKNPIKKLLYLMVRQPENLIMYHKFEKMRKKYLSMDKRCSNTQELKAYYRDHNDECFMTGSDQVWGPISTGTFDPSYFLDFAPKGAKKTAFAASFGKAEFDEETLRIYKEYLIRYDKIAVRENTAVDILSGVDVTAEQVLDPTLLLSSEKWEKYIIPVKKPKKYVLVYQIHSNPQLDIYAERFAEKAGLPLLRVSPLLHQFKRSGKLYYLPDIGGFLDLVKNAAYMVTDSFHGTAFAINFNTQFVEILPNTGTRSRNQSILQLLCLTDRIITDLSNFDLLNKQIDYTFCNDILIKEREKSLKILSEMLEQK